MGHSLLFSECHFAESLDLNGMERFELHGNRSGFFSSAYALRDYGVTGHWWLVSVAAVYDCRGWSDFRRSRTRRYRDWSWNVDYMSVRA